MTREEAKREMVFAKREVIADSWIDKAYDVAISALEQPDLIHCRECKHSDWYHTMDGKPFCYCMAHSSNGNKPDDFCSRAERRE